MICCASWATSRNGISPLDMVCCAPAKTLPRVMVEILTSLVSGFS